MRIAEVKIENFRLLKNFSISLRDTLSVVIGKNNTGKTSFILALKTFLAERKICFYDVNTDLRDIIIALLKNPLVPNQEEYEKSEPQMSLNMLIEYDEVDNLTNLSKFMVDLDTNNKSVSFCFKYKLPYDNYKTMRGELSEKLKGITDNAKQNDIACQYLKKNLHTFLTLEMYSYYKDGDLNNIHKIETKKDLSNLLDLHLIKAPRDFSKSEATTLSEFAGKFFYIKKQQRDQAIQSFQDKLEKIDTELKDEYEKVFSGLFADMKKYIDDIEIDPQVISKLSTNDGLLRDNTEVQYKNSLPEYYNGLGYLNFMSILFEIHLLIEKQKDVEKPDITLLFIEEPEAHTHPQMQYVFIKNIKDLLAAQKKHSNIQSVISSHSSHIVSQATFDDMKYFYIDKNANSVKVKNVSDLEKEFSSEPETFQFLKKYLTLNSSELFFASKAIFIEGDTERILLPAFMQKISKTDKTLKDALCQNISIIPVGGAYAHKFKPFMTFFDIKTLVITDIDYATDGVLTKKSTNAAINFFIPNTGVDSLIKTGTEEIEAGKMYVAFQKDGTRSFEDSFFEKNKKFIKDNKEHFTSLKNKNDLDTYTGKSEFSDRFISKKTDFATDIIYYSKKEDFADWDTPEYLEKGLKWLLA